MACFSLRLALAAGISELNWDAIAKHLGRGKRSVQRKYDNLKGSLSHGPPGGWKGEAAAPGLNQVVLLDWSKPQDRLQPFTAGFDGSWAM